MPTTRGDRRFRCKRVSASTLGRRFGKDVTTSAQLWLSPRSSPTPGFQGQLLITDTVHGLLGSADVPPMIDLGVWGPHGIGQTVHVYEVVVPGRGPSPRATEPQRRLLAVLFTDIAKSTDRAVEAGDRRWGEVLVRHHAAVREQLRRHHGVEVDTAGDGFFATDRTSAISGSRSGRDSTSVNASSSPERSVGSPWWSALVRERQPTPVRSTPPRRCEI
jgi:class 3 adenylate cyclase